MVLLVSDTNSTEGRNEFLSDEKLCNGNGKSIINNSKSSNNLQHEDYKSAYEGLLDIESYYSRLISEAPYIAGDVKPLTSVKDIAWADPDLLDKGILFGRKNIFSLVLANTAALMYGFAVKPESVVLLRSGKFLTPEDSFRRYLSTARRIGSWYIFNIAKEDSEAFKNIQIVRKLHHHYAHFKRPFPKLEEIDCTPEKIELAKAIRDDLEFLDVTNAPMHLLTWDPPLPFSQFDMAMTQFGFIGLVYLYPNALGISDMRELDGFLHYWAVLGRLLGLEDRFNLALHPDRALFLKLYENVGLASLKSTDETVICLQHSLIQGLSRRLPLLTLKGWVYYGLKEENENFEGQHVWKMMNKRDKLCYYSLKGTLSLVHKNVVVRFFVNLFTVFWLQMAYWLYLPKSSTSGCPF